MKTKVYEVEAWRFEGWWIGMIPELGIATQARRMSEMEHMARDLIAAWLDVSPASFEVDIKWLDGEPQWLSEEES